RPAARRRNAEYAEIVRRNMNSLHLFRTVAASQVETGTREIVRRDSIEYPVPVLESHELRNRLGIARPVRILPLDPHNPVRVRIRQRAQQNRVYNGKDGGIRPDPQRQRGNRGRGESWTLPQPAQRMA